MPDIGSRPKDDMIQSYRVSTVDDRTDWDLVLRESHHRMKNTLTLLGASVRREFGRARPGDVAAAVDRFERRLVAFGGLYQLLSNDSDIAAISVESFFERLCGVLSEAILEPAGIRCEAAIQDGTLSAMLCHRLALMLTELVTNAAKHAFPYKKDALIRVDVMHGDECWLFTVADNGTGATAPLQGTGSRIMEGLARSIRARMYGVASHGGTRVTIVVPAADPPG